MGAQPTVDPPIDVSFHPAAGPGTIGGMTDRRFGDLVCVYATQSLTDGYLARGRLESEGIPVVIKGEGEGPYRMGPAYLWVPDELEVQARLILEEIRDSRVAVGDDEDLLEDTDWTEAEREAPDQG
jgi:Putative prokaryotic signal transducing protein